MADYYPLIAKAVAGLEKNTGEARRTLYERARNALVTQLRGVSPALGESEITRERLALEEAIRKVEADAARKTRAEAAARGGSGAGGDRPERPDRAERPGAAERLGLGARGERPGRPDRPERSDRFDRHERHERPSAGGGLGGADRPAAPGATPGHGPSAPGPTSPGPSSPGSSSLGPSAPGAAPPGLPDADGTRREPSAQPPAQPSPDAGPETRPRRPGGAAVDRAPLSDRGLKGFRDVVAEAESLGEATASASKTAREVFAATAPTRDGTRIEPHVEPEGLRPPLRRPPPGRDAPPLTRENPPFSRDVPRRPPAGRDAEAPLRGPDPHRPDGGRGEAGRPQPGRPEPGRPEPGDADFAGRNGVRPYIDDHDYRESGGRPFPLQPETLPPRAEDEIGGPIKTPIGGRLLKSALALVAVLVVAGLGWWMWPSLSGLLAPSQPVATAPTPAPAGEPRSGKITDRVGAQPVPGTAARPQQDAPAVAQRVVLYEEDPADPGGKRSVGTAVWRTETIVAAPGQAPDTVVRADIEIPERNTSVRFSLRRNADRSLPASHTIEIMFTLPADVPNGGISNIPGILMKQAEQTRGVPLAGLAVKVTTNFFLIGLSSSDSDQQRNVQLLKERAWFDVPIVYGNNRRAIMAIEKGTPGERAFAEAFAAWGE